MAASASDKFQKVGVATATYLSAPGYTIGDTSVMVASTSNMPTDTGITLAMDVVDASGVQVPNTYNEYVGTVATGTSITNVSHVTGSGTNRNYSAGVTSRVYIPVSANQVNTMVDGILTSLDQSGNISADNAATFTSHIDVNDSSTSVRDTSDNELLKFVKTASAVNEVTVTNAATGNAPSLSATGGDSNIDIELTAKGAADVNLKPGTSNYVQKNGYPIDWWEELGRTTLGSAGDTITISSFPARKYLKILLFATATGGTITASIRFNNDTAANYSYRNSSNGGADGVAGSTMAAFIGAPARAAPTQVEAFLTNTTADEKTIHFFATNTGGAGAASAPDRLEGAGKWANTSAQITRLDIINGGTGDFAIGSEVVVLGHN